MLIPQFIVHYSRGQPFRSVGGLPKDELDKVLRELNESNAWGRERFLDTEYLDRRFQVEARLRKEFVFKGGQPILDYPIYFFLGRNPQFESHQRNKGYLIELNDLPKGAVSFTYGDSMFSLDEDYRQQRGAGYLSQLCPQVYTTDELPRLYAHPDMQSATGLQIEAQLWILPSETMFKIIE